MNNDDYLTMIFAYMDARPEEFDHDYVAKARERIQIVNDLTFPGKIVFEIERHRAWMGERYAKGQPMNSFITYWERYLYVQEPETMNRLGVVRHSEFHIGGCADLVIEDFSFEIQRVDGQKFQITESCTSSSAIVLSLAQAQEFAAELATGINFEGEMIRIMDAVAPDQLGECEAILRNTTKVELEKQICRVWTAFLEENGS